MILFTSVKLHINKSNFGIKIIRCLMSVALTSLLDGPLSHIIRLMMGWLSFTGCIRELIKSAWSVLSYQEQPSTIDYSMTIETSLFRFAIYYCLFISIIYDTSYFPYNKIWPGLFFFPLFSKWSAKCSENSDNVAKGQHKYYMSFILYSSAIFGTLLTTI